MLWWRHSWQWRACGGAWQTLPPSDTWIPPNAELRLSFRTRHAIPKGWFLFGIRHRGDNRRCTGWLKREGDAPFRQGRPMYPVRRRWRVVRLSHNGHVQLDLERVQHPLQLKELWLVHLPAWDSWRRIRRRLRIIEPGWRSMKRPQLWRLYNQLLSGQGHRHSLVSYERWQRLIEKPLVDTLAPLTPEQEKQFHTFCVGDPLVPLPAGHWQTLFPGKGYRLSAWAKRVVAAAISQKPGVLLIYGDEDAISDDAKRHSPQFKPAWNQELCWCDPLYSQCWFVAADLWNRWLAAQAPTSTLSHWQGLVLGLQAELRDPENQIAHVAMVLSHRYGGALPLPMPAAELSKLLPRGAHAKATSDHCGYRLQWASPSTSCLSVIIPTRDRVELLQACLKSIEHHQADCPLEIVIVDNGSKDAATGAFLEEFRERDSCQQRQVVVKSPGPFNYSALNNRAAEHCHGEVLLLLNNDVEFLHPGWGRELISQALRPGIGCVGAQLLYPDHTVQHGGVILGVGGLAGHAHQDYPAGSSGYQRRLQLSQEVSAVTAACLAISRVHWDQLGGLDAKDLAVNYNDVDLCLRAQQLGLKNLYLPQVKALHHESKSRGRPEGQAYHQWRQEWHFMQQRWGRQLQQDPAYSPHFCMENANFRLALRSEIPLVR